MQIILIPGFWLDGDSWGTVATDLMAAGHSVHAVSLPGKRPGDTDLTGIGLRDHVDAVVELVDSLPRAPPKSPAS